MQSNFTQNLKTLRKKSGITQGELGGSVGLTQKNIQTYESGIAHPSFGKLIDIADYFNVTVDELLKSEIIVENGIRCEVCDKLITCVVPCNHPKNGYCAVSRFSSAAETQKMMERINKI